MPIDCRLLSTVLAGTILHTGAALCQPPPGSIPQPTPQHVQQALKYADQFQHHRWQPPLRYTTPAGAIPEAYTRPRTPPVTKEARHWPDPYYDYCARYPRARECRRPMYRYPPHSAWRP